MPDSSNTIRNVWKSLEAIMHALLTICITNPVISVFFLPEILASDPARNDPKMMPK